MAPKAFEPLKVDCNMSVSLLGKGILENNKSVHKNTVCFLSRYPLSNEITQQRADGWDPCCTLYFQLISVVFYHLLHVGALYFYQLLDVTSCTLYFYHLKSL